MHITEYTRLISSMVPGSYLAPFYQRADYCYLICNWHLHPQKIPKRHTNSQKAYDFLTLRPLFCTCCPCCSRFYQGHHYTHLLAVNTIRSHPCGTGTKAGMLYTSTITISALSPLLSDPCLLLVALVLPFSSISPSSFFLYFTYIFSPP